MRRGRSATLVAVAALASGATSGSRADAAPNDGVYGRFDGDVDVSIAAGAGASSGRAAVGAAARALYLGTTGPYATAVAPTSSCDACRTFSVGAELRPLFLPRWGSGLERGPSRLDLVVDSLAIDVGARFSPGAPAGRARALELALSLEAPLGAGSQGLWLGARLAAAWPEATLGDRDGRAETSALAFVAFHFPVASHLVDRGDGLVR